MLKNIDQKQEPAASTEPHAHDEQCGCGHGHGGHAERRAFPLGTVLLLVILGGLAAFTWFISNR